MATTSSSSAGSYTQAKRAFRFESPLGKDAFILTSFTVTEEVSRPYTLTVDLLSDKLDVDPKKLIGQPASVVLALLGEGARHFHGIVSRFSQGGQMEKLASYRVEVVPKLWLFSQRRDNRIFQRLTVPEIVQQVLKGTDLKLQLMKSYPKREYCVQYGETSLDFVSRLMEEEGIYYYFEHAADKHTMVLADDPGAVKPCPELRAVKVDTSVDDAYDQNVIFRLEREHAVRSAKSTLWDYNFEKPTSRLQTEMPGDDTFKLELYDYPGGFAEPDQGERLARIRLEEQEAQQQVVFASSNVRQLCAGYKVDVTDHYRKDVNGAYLLTSVRHAGSLGNIRSEGEGARYQNEFTCIPAKTPYRPPRLTPKPVMPGTQSAVVVGPSGEEIWVDKYGRVKVQFHWDRQGKKDENSSCWMRVSSTWAGKQWGFVQLPRIGQEVLVDFLEGDPDQPIVTGRVYNADQMPPWALPDNQTQSGLKTRSSKGGGAANFNELRFEDKKGSEQVFLHAEKALDIEVEADETHTVGHDRKKTIENDETVLVKHDRIETVDNDETITIHGNRTETVDKDETITIAKNRTINIGDTLVENVGKDVVKAIDGERTVDISKDESLKVGKKILIDAGDELTIKVGMSKLVMKKDGTIQLNGKDFTVEASANVKMQASAMVDIKASGKLSIEASGMAEVKSSGILQVQGSLVKIN